MVQERGDIWDKDVAALEWAIELIREVQKKGRGRLRPDGSRRQ